MRAELGDAVRVLAGAGAGVPWGCTVARVCRHPPVLVLAPLLVWLCSGQAITCCSRLGLPLH